MKLKAIIEVKSTKKKLNKKYFINKLKPFYHKNIFVFYILLRTTTKNCNIQNNNHNIFLKNLKKTFVKSTATTTKKRKNI